MQSGELVRMKVGFRCGSGRDAVLKEGAVVMFLGPSEELPEDVVYVMTQFGRKSYHIGYLEPLDETG